MRNYFIITLVLFSMSFSAQNISGIITYNHSITPISKKILDSIAKNSKNKNPRFQKMTREIFSNTPDVKSFLEFNNEQSLYKVEDKMENYNNKMPNINRIFAGSDNIYYKNTKTKEYFYESNLGELLLIGIKPKKWQITQETKKLGNYTCYKAIDIESKNKKMKPIAWFTPEIPISFGPLDFNGLPGLVLQVELANRIINATNIVLNPKEDIKIEKPVKGKKITAEENQQRMDKFWKTKIKSRN